MNRWEDNGRLETELSRKLARRQAPANFIENVMESVRRGAPAGSETARQFAPRPKIGRWAAAALAAASLVVGFGVHRRMGADEAARLAEAREAEAHLVESLYLAGTTFNLARDAAFGAGGNERE